MTAHVLLPCLLLSCVCLGGLTAVCVQVEDMTVVDRLVDAPFHMYTHPDYGTKMRMLNEEVPFEMKFSGRPS